MQHDTNEEFKWDGDTLETKSGYIVALKTDDMYTGYAPNRNDEICRAYTKRTAEALIRQHMHEQNMANEFYIDILAPFVPGQPWNGFAFNTSRPDGQGLYGWLFNGMLLGEQELLLYASRIARGEIDDPRRGHKITEGQQEVIDNLQGSLLPQPEKQDYSVDANKKVEQPECPICSGDPSKSKFCPGCMDKIDEAQKPAPTIENMQGPIPKFDAVAFDEFHDLIGPDEAPKKTQLYAKHKSGFMFPIDQEGEKCYHFWLGNSDSRSFVQLRKSDCEVVEVPCNE